MFSKLFNKERKFSQEYINCNLSLILRNGWFPYEMEGNNLKNLLTLIKAKDGVGALQISVAISNKAEKTDINEQLRRNNEHPKDLKEYSLHDWTVYEFEENRDGNYVNKLYLIKLGVIVFVTYICQLENIKREEIVEALKIAKTVKVDIKS